MPTVQHPTFDNVTRQVPEADTQKWTDQGWKLLEATDEASGQPEPDKK